MAARILSLEAEQKVKLSLLQTELKEEIELLKIENRSLQEKLQHETHLKENLENVSSGPQQGSVFCGRRVVSVHQEVLRTPELCMALLLECVHQIVEERNASGFSRKLL